jgi:uncharacterized protein (TIGR02569 family)
MSPWRGTATGSPISAGVTTPLYGGDDTGNPRRSTVTDPPPTVLSAFGTDGVSVPLPEGEGQAFRVGAVVVKRVHDSDEANWVQSLLSTVEQRDFLVPEPVATTNGGWVCEGWVASRFVNGLRPLAPRWDEVITAGLNFSDAAERARKGGEDVLLRRSHRWAVADRVAWGENNIQLSPEAAEVEARLRSLMGESVRRSQLVHGDLTGNVYVAPSCVPVILDFSPYLRPRRWAAAIVIADAVLWNDADLSLAERFAADPTDRDLLGRAVLYRMVAAQLASDPRHGAWLEPYRRISSVLEHAHGL